MGTVTFLGRKINVHCPLLWKINNTFILSLSSLSFHAGINPQFDGSVWPKAQRSVWQPPTVSHRPVFLLLLKKKKSKRRWRGEGSCPPDWTLHSSAVSGLAGAARQSGERARKDRFLSPFERYCERPVLKLTEVILQRLLPQTRCDRYGHLKRECQNPWRDTTRIQTLTNDSTHTNTHTCTERQHLR